jgi:hypothetical protein
MMPMIEMVVSVVVGNLVTLLGLAAFVFITGEATIIINAKGDDDE